MSSTSSRCVDAAAETGTMLEINSSPDRRDLNDIHARAAAAAGVPIVINCDAHRVKGFEVARYGIATARRAWLTAADVANTRPWEEVRGAAAAPPMRLAGALVAERSWLAAACGLGRSTRPAPATHIELSSPAFAPGGEDPRALHVRRRSTSPCRCSWTGVPAQATSSR